jgi:hypothetical protein
VAAKLAHGLPTTLWTKPAWSYLRLRNRIIRLCTTVNIRQRRRLPSFHSSIIACISSISGVVDINNGRDVARASALNAVYDEGDPECNLEDNSDDNEGETGIIFAICARADDIAFIVDYGAVVTGCPL